MVKLMLGLHHVSLRLGTCKYLPSLLEMIYQLYNLFGLNQFILCDNHLQFENEWNHI